MSLYPIRPACLSSPANLLCVSSPAGGALPAGSEPTVDTVSVQPIPTFWYYVMAGAGALLLLASATLIMVLCCYRYRLAAKKTQHTVSYQSHPNHLHYHSSGLAGPGLEPMLSIRMEKDEHPCSQG